MSTILIPADDKVAWPSLGGEVCAFIEGNLVHGPGDLLGEPVELDDETRWLIWRMYEVFPHDHALAGRRRFKRVALSMRKGTAKTEKAAWLAAVELHPDGPVRCTGWRRRGRSWQPIGGPVTDPYIPMVAYTEEQSEELAYGALYAILTHDNCPIREDFDVGLNRVKRITGEGSAVPLATAPSSRDGARTTFQHFDETEHFRMPRQREAHRTMLLNIPKRKAADGWSLETAVAPVPGEGSVAEGTMDYAVQVRDGAIKDSRLFFFHRQAGERFNKPDLTPAEITEAVIEASGPYAAWSDIPSIVSLWQDPDADRSMLAQRWLNMLVMASDQGFDVLRWNQLARPDHPVPDGALVVLSFHGARYWDAAALLATEIATGFQWPLGIWQHPMNRPAWEVPEDEVDLAVANAFDRFSVWRFYVNPDRWESSAANWARIYGEDRVRSWRTNAWTHMSRAVRAFDEAIRASEVTHPGLPMFTAHIGACRRRYLAIRDDDDQQVWVPVKERSDSPHPINAAMGAIIGWQARLDALHDGADQAIEWTAV